MLDSTLHARTQDFFADPILYQTMDAWGDIYVVGHLHYRNLMFDSFYDQSSMDVNKPHILVHEYTRAMMLALAFIKPQHVTILGLGGGCLLRSLNHLLPECKLHAVELRQQVYEVAADFFGIPNNKKITITISDAKQQLKATENNSTNIIFADMYNAYNMNPFQVQKNFIDQCYRVLSYKGWLVVNYHELSDLNKDFLEYLCGTFSDTFVCSLPKGNSILFASKHRIDSVCHFDAAVAELEKKLEIKLTHLFKQMTRLYPN